MSQYFYSRHYPRLSANFVVAFFREIASRRKKRNLIKCFTFFFPARPFCCYCWARVYGLFFCTARKKLNKKTFHKLQTKKSRLLFRCFSPRQNKTLYFFLFFLKPRKSNCCLPQLACMWTTNIRDSSLEKPDKIPKFLGFGFISIPTDRTTFVLIQYLYGPRKKSI